MNGGVFNGTDSASRDLVLRHYNTITAENVLKAGPVNPRPGVYNWEPADAFVAFGEKHGMFIVGHTLVWHNQTPPWFFTDAEGKPNTPAQQLERMRSHIEAVAGRDKGRIHAWDVVNGVIGDDGSHRPTTLGRGVGDGAARHDRRGQEQRRQERQPDRAGGACRTAEDGVRSDHEITPDGSDVHYVDAPPPHRPY